MATVGRPPIYSQALADEVFRRMSEGESLSSVCRDESMPCLSTVMKWDREIPEFSQQYAIARENLQAYWAEQILQIADTPQMGVKTEIKGEEVKTVEGDMIEHRRLQVDARKWLLSKLAPKKYGDRTRTELTGKDGAPLMPTAPTLADFYTTVTRIPVASPADNKSDGDSKPDTEPDPEV